MFCHSADAQMATLVLQLVVAANAEAHIHVLLLSLVSSAAQADGQAYTLLVHAHFRANQLIDQTEVKAQEVAENVQSVIVHQETLHVVVIFEAPLSIAQKLEVIDHASKAHTVVKLAQVVIEACVACVVAVSGASQVIVDTVQAFHVIDQAIALVHSKSVNHHLVTLVQVTQILQLIVISFAHSARVQVEVIAQHHRVQTQVISQVVSAIVTTEF
jgi:hypothetical protein